MAAVLGRRYEGRAALVTGAGGGIGRAVALRLAAEGAVVACADVRPEAAAASAEAVCAAGGRAEAVVLDVTDAAQAEAAVGTGVLAGRLDLLVNVAGVLIGGARTGDFPIDGWERVLAVNLTGTLVVSQAALPALLDGGGAIVNVASVAGVRASPYNAAYAASKAGVIALTKAMAAEYGASGLRANCVCPTAIDTPFLARFSPPPDADLGLLARMRGVLPGVGHPDDVAAAVAYLGSDEASMVTGTTLMLDGGATA